jgi:hypothetical protein
MIASAADRTIASSVRAPSDPTTWSTRRPYKAPTEHCPESHTDILALELSREQRPYSSKIAEHAIALSGERTAHSSDRPYRSVSGLGRKSRRQPSWPPASTHTRLVCVWSVRHHDTGRIGREVTRPTARTLGLEGQGFSADNLARRGTSADGSFCPHTAEVIGLTLCRRRATAAHGLLKRRSQAPQGLHPNLTGLRLAFRLVVRPRGAGRFPC